MRVAESERESEKKRSFKTKAQKLKSSGKFKSHTIGALIPMIRTRHMAMIGVVPPPRIKYGAKSQEPCLGQEAFHLLMVVTAHHDDHRTWGATDGTD